MAAPRATVNPRTHSVGIDSRLVMIMSVSPDGKTAVCADAGGTEVRVPMLAQRSKGALPLPGESWLISQDSGQWTFQMIMTDDPSAFDPVIPPGSIVAADIAEGAVTGSALAPGALNGQVIDSPVITTGQILKNAAAPAAPAGGSALYSAAGRPATVSFSGVPLVLSSAPAPAVTTVTVTTATALASLSAGYPVPALEPAAGSEYMLIASGNGVWGTSASPQTLTLQATLGGVSLGSLTLGANLFPVTNQAFRWLAEISAVCVTPGSGGTWTGGINGIISVTGTTLLPAGGANASLAFTAGVAAPVTVSTTVPQVLILQAVWGGGSTAQEIFSLVTRFRRPS